MLIKRQPMAKYILTLGLLIFGLNAAYSTSHEQIQQIAEAILDELYVVHGNTSVEKPHIVVTDNEKEVASYHRRSNSIVLSTKAFSVCRSFDSELRSALAFIIGHELSHAFQSEFIYGTTGFLAHSAHPETREHLENQADIQGVFMAYLAGYETTELLPELIDRIYDSYGLKSKKLIGYPSLSERQSTNAAAILLSNQLLDVFKGGNYLTIIGDYELAASCFEYIKNYYQGQEIFNNLGVNYALHALHLTDENIEPFVYPFEIDWNTRLRKPQSTVGTKNLNPQDRRLREKYLTKAQSAFKKVLKQAPLNYAARINLMSVYNLRGDYMAAMNEFEKDDWYLASDSDLLRANLVKAVTYFRVGNKEKAKSIFQQLSKNRNEAVAVQASCNLESLRGETVCKNDPEICLFAVKERSFVKPVLQQMERGHELVLLNERGGIELEIYENKKYKRLTFSRKGKDVITLNWDFENLKRKETNNLNYENLKHALKTSNGFLIPCHEQRVIYRLSNDHALLEKVFY
jgi:tetratricopeptide (TPR) repeat protein